MPIAPSHFLPTAFYSIWFGCGFCFCLLVLLAFWGWGCTFASQVMVLVMPWRPFCRGMHLLQGKEKILLQGKVETGAQGVHSEGWSLTR